MDNWAWSAGFFGNLLFDFFYIFLLWIAFSFNLLFDLDGLRSMSLASPWRPGPWPTSRRTWCGDRAGCREDAMVLGSSLRWSSWTLQSGRHRVDSATILQFWWLWFVICVCTQKSQARTLIHFGHHRICDDVNTNCETCQSLQLKQLEDTPPSILLRILEQMDSWAALSSAKIRHLQDVTWRSTVSKVPFRCCWNEDGTRASDDKTLGFVSQTFAVGA